MRTDKTPRPTGMAVAFYQALLQEDGTVSLGLIRKVESSITRNVGLVREREVDAHVSYRTAQKLKQEGVL